VGAKVYTTRGGYALDTFEVLGRRLSIDAHRDLIDHIESALSSALRTSEPIPAPVSGRSARVVKHFPIPVNVRLRPQGTQGRYEIAVEAADRPGLLSRLAKVFHDQGLSVHGARVTTLGARAEDIFDIDAPEMDEQASTALVRGIESALA
jgi:[protein-PII] uridylyltransferase